MGKIFKVGYVWMVSVYFMMVIIVFYLIFVLKLYCLVKSYVFIILVDYIYYCFGGNCLMIFILLIMIVGVVNFLVG